MAPTYDNQMPLPELFLEILLYLSFRILTLYRTSLSTKVRSIEYKEPRPPPEALKSLTAELRLSSGPEITPTTANYGAQDPLIAYCSQLLYA